jgi:predicted AAA+ superfamily ATPase
MDDLLHQPWVGASWEGFVVHQVLGLLAARGESVDSYYFRTSDGYETDLVFKLGSRLWAVEAKLSASPSQQDFSRFNTGSQLVGADRRYLVAKVSKPSLGDTSGVLSLSHLLDLLEKQF